jgi:hypothetical protein
LLFIQGIARIPTNLQAAAQLGSKFLIYGGFTGDASLANAVSFDTRMHF